MKLKDRIARIGKTPPTTMDDLGINWKRVPKSVRVQLPNAADPMKLLARYRKSALSETE